MREIPRWRQVVVSVLRCWEADADAMELAGFGVGELLSNVAKHVQGGECRLEVVRLGDRAVIQVRDLSPLTPEIVKPDWDSESGRGLWLLHEMADDLGWKRVHPQGKITWFTCRLAGTREAAA
ncbi:ATP-binding protein [Streptomyces hoynatensis]|uniref:ATP-binding protein n=1 Tax=Streptomyces hoynatensis TaxID=1141874 RepID=UPI001319F26F|nr:ATP-binding protein [Streptomyces hoynatensis]